MFLIYFHENYNKYEDFQQQNLIYYTVIIIGYVLFANIEKEHVH